MNYSGNFNVMDDGFSLAQAAAEAQRCLLCHDAPCSKGCPGKTDPATFIRKLRFRNVTGAIRTIKKNNTLGGTCGVVCPSSMLCEKECSARGLDRPVQIGKIQRALIEHSWKIKFNPVVKDGNKNKKIAVVGSGPAGLSCAAELAKHGYRVTVFEAKQEPGGVLRYGVPSYRLSGGFLKREIDDLKSLGIEIKCSSPVHGKKAAENLLKEGFDAVFIATGLWKPARLKNDVQEIGGLMSSTEFLAATRENKVKEIESIVTGKRVAVIGGGFVALDCCESALKLGARDVYLVYRRSFKEMPADDTTKTEILKNGVHFLPLNRPLEYLTDRKSGDTRLRGIKLLRLTLEGEDSSGRRKPGDVEGSEWELEADVVIEAIGSEPTEESSELYPSLKLTKNRLIQVNQETGETSMRGIFAGGDITRGPAYVVSAVADGKTAAASIRKFLDGKEAE